MSPLDQRVKLVYTRDMEATAITTDPAVALFSMLADKVWQAMANGATEEQAIKAVRLLVLEHLGR